MFLDHLPLDKLHNRKTAFGRLKLKVLYNPSEHWPDMSLLIVLVRMIDKMIDQRRIVYNNISKWLKGKDLRHFSLACSYSEDIISDAKRMVKFIKAHRSMKEAHVRVERKIFKQVILREKEITNLRNALQHLDKEISSGKIQTGQDYGLVLTNTDYKINNFKISYEDLDDFLLECDSYIKNVIGQL